jgi:hypothetical protein
MALHVGNAQRDILVAAAGRRRDRFRIQSWYASYPRPDMPMVRSIKKSGR